MLKIGVWGITGKNGTNVMNEVAKSSDKKIVLGVYGNDEKQRILPEGFPVFTQKGIMQECGSLMSVSLPVDGFGLRDLWFYDMPNVIIDFSSPQSLDFLLWFAQAAHVPLVLCTTGYSAEQLEEIKEASKDIAIVQGYGADMTANEAINLINEVSWHSIKNSYGATAKGNCHAGDMGSGNACPRLASVSLRDASQCHNIKVELDQECDSVTVNHKVGADELCAQGAVRAAEWVTDRLWGLYDMNDVLGLNKSAEQ